MNEAMQVFRFGNEEVRVFSGNDGEPWWAAKDVCDVLGYQNSRKALADHVDEDEKGVTNSDTLGGTQSIAIINESGLYSLILRSRKPEAKKFKRWVTHEVLPSIRQGGGYMTAETAMAILSDPAKTAEIVENMLKLTHELRTKNMHQQMLIESKEEQIEALEPRARYCDEVLASNSLITTNLIAKELGTAAVTLNRKLQEWGVQYRQSGTWFPYQRFQDRGLGKMTTHTFNRCDGSRGTKSLWKWNEKGRMFIHQLWTDKMGAAA